MDSIRLKKKQLQSKMYLTHTQTHKLIRLTKAVNSFVDDIRDIHIRIQNNIHLSEFDCDMIFSHPNLKTCNWPYMQYYFKQFFVLHSPEAIFLFLIKRSRQKAIKMETALFHFLGNPKGRTLDHLKTVQVHLIIWTTSVI